MTDKPAESAVERLSRHEDEVIAAFFADPDAVPPMLLERDVVKAALAELEAERDEAREECVRLQDELDLVGGSGLVKALAELKAANEALRRERDEMLDAINWACGCGDSDFPGLSETNNRAPYWWRGVLIDKAGLVYNRDSSLYEPRAELDRERG